jgi:beta-glucosidase/6-phospho-beta-glucosidase/beta-galactosidase
LDGKFSVTLHRILPLKIMEERSLSMPFYCRFMDPLTRGDYPLSMRALVGNRLPQFTKEQSRLMKGAFDFIGLNYYTTNYADNLPPSNGLNVSYDTDARANLTGNARAKT